MKEEGKERKKAEKGGKLKDVGNTRKYWKILEKWLEGGGNPQNEKNQKENSN